MSDAQKAQKSRRAALKAASAARRKAHYKAQPARTDANQKRRMRKHLRAHPTDEKNADIFERVLSFGPVIALGLSSKGKKRAQRTKRSDAA